MMPAPNVQRLLKLLQELSPEWAQELQEVVVDSIQELPGTLQALGVDLGSALLDARVWMALGALCVAGDKHVEVGGNPQQTFRLFPAIPFSQ